MRQIRSKCGFNIELAVNSERVDECAVTQVKTNRIFFRLMHETIADEHGTITEIHAEVVRVRACTRGVH